MSSQAHDSQADAFTAVVVEVLEVDPADVTDAAGPQTLPTWTSLRHLQLIVTLEEIFGISFAYREIRDLRTIGDVRRALLAKRPVPATA